MFLLENHSQLLHIVTSIFLIEFLNIYKFVSHITVLMHICVFLFKEVILIR